ncbi:unnamed protein product [Prorocentrum cordatum]|uniref:Uncharacterized protein n=1 Tax=Prorocentrum cordatum TaxID=2364126 RepID=A0ABN9T486_9DINO|nr:unnamed protein product [Polarella glacialis]
MPAAPMKAPWREASGLPNSQCASGTTWSARRLAAALLLQPSLSGVSRGAPCESWGTHLPLRQRVEPAQDPASQQTPTPALPFPSARGPSDGEQRRREADRACGHRPACIGGQQQRAEVNGSSLASRRPVGLRRRRCARTRPDRPGRLALPESKGTVGTRGKEVPSGRQQSVSE